MFDDANTRSHAVILDNYERNFEIILTRTLVTSRIAQLPTLLSSAVVCND
jgi:hypothetical protein